MKILALEASTTSAKSMLFDTETQETIVETRRFEVDGPDTSVRDAESIFTQLMALGRESALGHSVDLVALSGTWHGLTLRDAELNEISPVQEWSYTGAQDLCANLRQDEQFTEWFYRRTGCMVNAIYPAFKLMLLRENGVDISGGTVLDQNSYNFARMTGWRATSVSQASGTGLLNAETCAWDQEILTELGLTEVHLPELTDGETTAPLQAEAAALLGMEQGVRVLVPGPDGGMNQVGNAATSPGEMTFSMGTSGALRLAAEAPSFSPRMSTWSYRSPVGWLSGAAASGCTNCVDWAKDRLFEPGTTYADIEPQLSDEVRDLPLFMPFLFGERCPGWQDQRRGGFLELHPSHSRADMYQSVLHGVTLSLYHCYRELTALNGAPERIILSGGVLSSPFWTQLVADVFRVPMELSELQHSSVVGAVRMGLRALGLDEDQPAFREESRRVVRPRPELADYYAAQFQRYLEGYTRTHPGSASLAKEDAA
ncbi:gluconokinase [Nesterenkonia populi]|uniref:gluconokinase n=1 Tax=Nesterenkonia populi TaxID=1591087 RepID=UPI0011BF42F8|nr:FGGY-family carbohydrate kinase [Nesterenkonia populi]